MGKIPQRTNRLGCDVKGNVAGFSSLAEDGYFDLLYVHHNFQGKGIATLLEEALVLEAKNQGQTNVWASVSVTAQPFFKQKGYIETRKEIRKVEDQEFENAIMEKQLT